MGIEQVGPQTRNARFAALKLENDRVSFRIATLNQEMVRLSVRERRERWQDYYRDLGWLMKRQEQLSKAMEAIPPSSTVLVGNR